MNILLSGYLLIVKSNCSYNIVAKYSKFNDKVIKVYDFYSKDGNLEVSYLEEITKLDKYRGYWGKKHVCSTLLKILDEIESSFSVKTSKTKTLSPRGVLEVEQRVSDVFVYSKTMLEGLTIAQEFKSSDYIFLLKEVCYEPSIEYYFNGEGGIYTVPRVYYKEFKQVDKSLAARIKTIDELKLEYNLEWLESKDYRIVSDIEEFDKVVEHLNKCVEERVVVAVDTETTGLKFNRLPRNHPSRDKLLGICLSWGKDQGIYIPVNHTRIRNIPEEYALLKLKYFLENGVILTHYGTFDWKVFWDYGINLNIMHDTYILQYLIDVNSAKAVKKLKALTNLYIRYKGEPIHQLELEDFFPKVGNKKQKIIFDALGEEEIRCYAPADADFTRQLFFILYPKLDKELYGIYGVEMRLLKEIAYTEFYGIKINLETLQQKYEDSIKEKEQITKEIYELAGEEFDINSPKQLSYILYTKLKFPVLKEGKTGASTGRAVLQDLLRDERARENPKVAIVEKLLKYRELEKLISGFYQKLIKEHVDGWVFPHFNQAGTESGRIAGYEPNLQQISKKIRDIFVSDSDEFYIFDADYSQIELRVMAGMAGDDYMIKAFSDPDTDIHVAKAALLYGIPEDKVDKEMRTQCKKLNFGIPYGMGPVTLAHEIFGVVTQETVEKAKFLYNKYFETSPKLKDLFVRLKEFASLTGYSLTKFGRKRYIPDITSSDRKKRESALRKAGNTPIQGTAADILKIAYVRLATRLRELFPSSDLRNPLVRIAGSVHDEVLLVVHKSINPWVLVKIVRECMELKIDGFPPIFTGMHVCNTWGDGKRDDLEIPIKLSDKMIKQVEEHPEMFSRVEDPVNYVFEYIKQFRLDEIKAYLESLGFNSLPIFLVAVRNKFDNLTCKKAVKDLFDDDLKKVLELIYGKENVIDDLPSDKQTEPLEKEEDLDDYFMNLRNKVEGVSDEEFEDYEEAVVYKSDDKNLLLEENPIRKLKDRLYNEMRVIYFDLYIKIKVDGITKEGLEALKNYLKSVHTNNGYDILLEIGGRLINTNLKAIRLDDDELIKCLYYEEYKKEVELI